MGHLASAPKSFKHTLQTSLGLTEFDFVNMNIGRKYLFQVWAPFEGKKVRFHMQRTEKDEFRITLREICPAPFLELEDQLAEAIVNS